MVKIFLLIVWLSIISCAGTKKYTYSKIVCDIHFNMSIIKGSLNEPITFLLTNPNAFDVEVARPDCMASTAFNLYNQAGEPARAGIMVRANSGCRKEFIRLPAHDSVEVVFRHTLNELFNVEKNMRYRLLVKYGGELKIGNERCKTSHTIEGSLIDTVLTIKSSNH